MGTRIIVVHGSLTPTDEERNLGPQPLVLIGPLNNAQINEPFDALTAEGKSAAQSTAIRRPFWHMGKICHYMPL